MRLKTLPIFLAFFLMGFADAMSPLRDAVQADHGLSNFISALLPFVVFIAFAIFSIPGGLLAARIGKKKLLLLGLGLNIIALLIPSIQSPSFPLLLGWLRDLGWGAPSCIVPALCFAYLLLISIKGGGKPADASYARDTAEAA